MNELHRIVNIIHENWWIGIVIIFVVIVTNVEVSATSGNTKHTISLKSNVTKIIFLTWCFVWFLGIFM